MRAWQGAVINAVAATIWLACGASAQWSDQTLVSAGRYGPDLALQGDTFNMDGTTVKKTAVSYTAKSVMTGLDSYFPSTLPDSLKVPFLAPDSTHPNLAFWYTPDVFVRDGVADGTKVAEWVNVANICYDGSSDSTSCTLLKKGNKQAVSGGNTKYVESLRQDTDSNRPTYKKSVLNGYGVVRFSRTADGTSGKYLEMFKRCTTTDCGTSSSTAGFVTDWTNSQTTPANAAFTIFMVLRTRQSSSDTNPMGILNLVTTGSKAGLGFYKTEAKCFKYAGTLKAQTSTDTLVNAVVFKAVPSTPASPPSDIPRVYEGDQISVFGVAADAQTGVQKQSSRCTVAKYILVAQLTTSIPASASTSITIRGGRGKIGGDDEMGTNGFASKAAISANTVNVRFGTITASNAAVGGISMPADVSVTSFTSGGTGNADTVLTVASFTPSAIVPAGTNVYIGIGTEFHVARLTSCTSTSAQATDAPFDIIPLTYQAPDCPPNTFRQLGTLTAYYGGVTDDSGDSGCATECATAGGCDVATGKFGLGNSCRNKWGTARKLQNPDSEWRVVAMKANGNEFKAYIDGIHDGCGSASGTCSITPPISILGTSVALNRLRIGLMDTTSQAAVDFSSMDLAEMMIYDKVLTAQEMDRIGNYLASKFGLDHFVLNDDVRSPTRTVPVSKNPGCDNQLLKKHDGKPCDGISPSSCLASVKKLTLASSADSTDNYYVGMRLTVTGGGDSSNAAGIHSSVKQSCLITAYSGSSKIADCDFTSLGSAHILWTGSSYPPSPGNEAVTAFDTNLTVSWAPTIPTPFYALLGNPGYPRAVVQVLSVTIIGTYYQLTVERALGATVRSPIASADTNAFENHLWNTITYSRTYLAGDTTTAKPTVGFPGATSLLIGSLDSYVTSLTQSVSNWRVQLSSAGSAGSPATELVQASSTSPISFTIVTTGLATSSTSLTITADSTFSNLAVGDLLQIGDLTTGEVVTITTACDLSGALTGSGSAGVACAISRWLPTAGQTFAAVGTTVTRVSYRKMSTAPVVTFTVSVALTAAATAITFTADTGFTTPEIGDLLLVGSEVIYVAAACTSTNCPTITRGQSMSKWASSTTASDIATATVAAAASIGTKIYLVGRAKGSALSVALDSATLTYTIANTAGLSISDTSITLTSPSPYAFPLLAAGDVLQVGTELISLSGSCSVISDPSSVSTTCSNTPVCSSTGCSCGICPIRRAQLSSTAATAAAAATVTIKKRGTTTYANPVAVHIQSAFTVAAQLYVDAGSGGAVGTATIVGALPTLTCTDAGRGYSTLPNSVVIGSNSIGTIQPATCLVTFAIAAGTANTGKVTVTLSGAGTSNALGAGCLAGTFNIIFLGGSGSLTPGDCTIAFAAGTHTSSISAAGTGFAAAPVTYFLTGTQPRGCLATSIGGLTPASGALPAAPTPTFTSINGCLLGTAYSLYITSPTLTAASGTYIVPGLLPVLSPAVAADAGTGYISDYAHLSATFAACLDLTIAFTAGTNPGTVKYTLTGTNSITGKGVGCIIGNNQAIVFTYTGTVTPAPSTLAGTISIAPGTAATFAGTNTGTCTGFECTGGGSGYTTVVPTITLSSSGACVLTASAVIVGGAGTGTLTITVAGSSTSSTPIGVGCVIGTAYSFTFTGGDGTPPTSMTITFPAPAAAPDPWVTATPACTTNECDNQGSNFVQLPTSISIGTETTNSPISQPSTCVITYTVLLGSAVGTYQISAIAGSSAALGVGCLIGTYNLVVSGGVGTTTGSTIVFASGTVAATLASGGTGYPTRPRVTMGGQPNSCQATADSGLTFTAGVLSGTGTTFGGALTGCLINGASSALNLDVASGLLEPAVGTYTIAGGALTAAAVTAGGFGYSVMPTPIPSPSGTGGQASACSLTSITTSTTTVTSSALSVASLAGVSSNPSTLSGCTNGIFSLVFSKPKTYSISITSDTPYAVSSLNYNDLLLVGREVVRIAGACSSASPPVCPLIRGQQFTTPAAHASSAKTVLLKRAPAPGATPLITFTLTAASAVAATTITMTADTWFPGTSLAYGDTLLLKTVILQVQAACTVAAGVYTCGTVARAQQGTTDVGGSIGDKVILLPATSVTYSLGGTLSGSTAFGSLSSLTISRETSVLVTALNSGDMLLINSEIVQLSGSCSGGSPCKVARAKGGTALAAAATGDKALLVRRVNGYSLSAPITFTVSNPLGLAAGDTVVTLSASSNFAVQSLATNDILLVGAEFLKVSGGCSAVGACPIVRGVTFMGSTSTASVAASTSVVTLIRRPSSTPPSSSEVLFSIAAPFGSWGLVGLGDCPNAATGCGSANGCRGSCPSTPTFGSTLLSLTADGTFGVQALAENELLMIGTELVRVTGPCHTLGCPVRRAQQYSEFTTQSLDYANRLSKAVLVTSSATTFTISNSGGLATAATTITIAADTSFNVANLVANDLLLVGSEVVRVASLGCGKPLTITFNTISCTGAVCDELGSGYTNGGPYPLVSIGTNTIATGSSAIGTLSQPASCDITIAVSAGTTNTLLKLTFGGSSYSNNGLGCVAGTFALVFTTISGATAPVGTITLSAITFSGITCTSAGVCDSLGSSYTTGGPYPSVTIGTNSVATPLNLVGTLSQPATCSITIAVEAGTTANTIKLTFGGSSFINNGLGCIDGTFTLVVSTISGATAPVGTITFAGTACHIARAQLTPTGTASDDPGSTYIYGTKVTYLQKGIQRGYSAASGVQVDLAYVPQPTTVTSQAFTGGSAVSTYSIDRCDSTATPASRDGPIQIIVGNEYLKAPGSNYGGSFAYDTMTGGNAFWIDGYTPISGTADAGGAAGGGTVVEIKGWHLLPTDLDLAYDGTISFTVSTAVASGDTSLILKADTTSFTVQSLAVNDYLLIGTEIVKIAAVAAAGTGPSTPVAIAIVRAQSSSVAAAYGANTKAMLLSRTVDGSTTNLKTFTVTAANVGASPIAITSPAATLFQGDLLLEPTTGEVIRITATSCTTSCAVARGQRTPLGLATISQLTSTTLVFLKRPSKVASGPIVFSLPTTNLLAADVTITLTPAADPITFTLAADVLAAATSFTLTADTTYAVSSLLVGDLLLVGTEVVVIATAALTSSPTVVSVTRAQNDATGTATTAAGYTAGAKFLYIDASFQPVRLKNLPRPSFGLSSLAEGDLLYVGSEIVRVMGPCGLNAQAKAPAAQEVCPISRGYLGTTAATTVSAGATTTVTLLQRATLDGNKIDRTDNYLLVTAGSRPAECRNPIASAPCVPGKSSLGEVRLQCSIREVRQGFCANDRSVSCRCGSGRMCPDCPSNGICRASIDSGVDHVWPFKTKPALRCVLPPALGPNQDLNIYFHGIKTTLSNWYRPDAPTVTSVVPSNVAFSGGDTVTVNGRNFGPSTSWVRSSSGGATEAGRNQARVDLIGPSVSLSCADTVYVSDAQLLCKVPPLPMRRQAVDTGSRSVAVSLVVDSAGQRSSQTSRSALVYTSVPAYYACQNGASAPQARADCFSCCRSACVVDQFAQGGQFAGGTFSLCDVNCNTYCAA